MHSHPCVSSIHVRIAILLSSFLLLSLYAGQPVENGPSDSAKAPRSKPAMEMTNRSGLPDCGLGCGVFNYPPTVRITNHPNYVSITSGIGILFVGSAIDPEDGNISSGISWTSNLDGSLGTGSIVGSVLSVGTHTITASATDMWGLTCTDSITVVVSAP